MNDELKKLEKEFLKIFEENNILEEDQLKFELFKLRNKYKNLNEDEESKVYEFYEDERDDYDEEFEKIYEIIQDSAKSKLLFYCVYNSNMFTTIDNIIKNKTIDEMDGDNDDDILLFFEPLLEKVETIYPEKEKIIKKLTKIIDNFYREE